MNSKSDESKQSQAIRHSGGKRSKAWLFSQTVNPSTFISDNGTYRAN